MQETAGPTRGREPLAAVCGLDDPVRRSLYAHVSGSREPVGRDDAAAAAGVGRALAAYHLDKLVSLGLLTASYRRPAGRGGPGAGRPAKVYARSPAEFAVSLPPREYELAASLLAHAVESDPAGSARAELERAARRFGADLGQGCGSRPAGDVGSGTEALMTALTEHGFEPWQDQDGTVVLSNCPFHKLAARYINVVCGMNLALLEGVVSGVGTPGLHAELDPAPGRCCVVIRTSAETGQHSPGEQ
jgi:predicted ArsR family transcriptional regulator